MSDVSFIGLGAMGRPLVRNLLRAGHVVTVWNRSPGPVAALAAEGAVSAERIEEALAGEVILSMLSDDDAFAETFLSPAALDAMPEGGVHVNLATVSTALARDATASYAARGIGYIAAPVFGRVAVAEVGKLNILAAGDTALLDRVQPLFDVIGARTWRLGERLEQANMVKILGNYLIACAIEALGEAVALGDSVGVDAEELVEVLTGTLFPGAVYSSYGGMIAKERYRPAGFTTLLGRKDLHLVLDAAADRAVPLPVGEVLRSVFDDALRAGHGEDDWAVVGGRRRRGDG